MIFQFLLVPYNLLYQFIIGIVSFKVL